MHENHRLEQIPLDTPDADPRWALFEDTFDFGFLGRRPSAASLDTSRQQARADGSILDVVTSVGPGLDGRQAVAAFQSAPYTMNAGAGIVDCLVIQGIAVRSTHRRRGILRHMMDHRLRAARDAGLSYAVLTASEAAIYGRYGFGVATRQFGIDVDTAKFSFRKDVEVADGCLEFVAPSFLAAHFDRISLAHQRRYRGAQGRLEGHRMTFTGAWDRKEEGPSRSLRTLMHFDSNNKPDGFAVFIHQGWDTAPITTSVLQVCSPSPAIDRALWQQLVDIDLVEKLTYEFSHPEDPLPLSLVNPRAVSVRRTVDAVWLRILDLEKAVAERGFEADGSVVVSIVDAQEFCSGTWRISVRDGVGSAQRCEDTAEVMLGIDTLAAMWFGDRTAATLAQAGLVEGETAAVDMLSRVFRTAEPPVNLSSF